MVGVTVCPGCRQGVSERHVVDHIAACGTSGAYGAMALRTVAVVRGIMMEAGCVTRLEVPRLVADTEDRPGDIVAMSEVDGSHHVLVDVTLVHPLTQTYLSRAQHPGQVAREAESRKLRRYRALERTGAIRGHRFIPFGIEDLGRSGDHASAYLEELAGRTADRLRIQEGFGRSRPRVVRDTLRTIRERISISVHAGEADLIYSGLMQSRADAEERGG